MMKMSHENPNKLIRIGCYFLIFSLYIILPKKIFETFDGEFHI